MSVRIAHLDASPTVLSTLVAGSTLDRAIKVAAVLLVDGADGPRRADQRAAAVHARAVHAAADGRAAWRRGARGASRDGESGALLALGIAGFPVFAASAVLPQGALRLLGPTGGYLMSYPFAAFVAGALAERGFDRRYFTSVLAMGAGLAVVFAFGVLWLAWFARPVHTGLGAALRTGLYPFLPADIIKICIAAAIMPGVWTLIGRRP